MTITQTKIFEKGVFDAEKGIFDVIKNLENQINDFLKANQITATAITITSNGSGCIAIVTYEIEITL